MSEPARLRSRTVAPTSRGCVPVKRWRRPAGSLIPLLEQAEMLAGDESDGVFWGVYYELGGV